VRIQSELGVRELLDTIVELIPESGVKITRNGTEVQQVKLREIPELEVTTTTPILQTPVAITIGAISILAVIIIVIIKLKKK
jgi:phytoene dehydrogenase-like protein